MVGQVQYREKYKVSSPDPKTETTKNSSIAELL
jgi:hypothetical protein